LLLVLGKLEENDLHKLANKILKFVAIDQDIQGLNLSISASVGMATIPEHTQSPDELIRFADAAMYEAKSLGKNRWITYKTEHSEKSASKITMVSAIRQAIDLEEFDFVLQPKFNSTKQIIGAELLARWHSPQLGPISPVQFIPAIENNGLAKDFGNLVIDMGARYVQWLQRLGFDIPVAINLSAIQLMADGLVDTLRETCDKYRIPLNRLELEITESVLLQEGSDPMQRLNQLDELGFSIAMDDFGTGYSSLNYLRHMPFSIVKVDRAFVIDADEDPRAKALLQGIVGMCQSLGMKVVAEGIETEAQFELLKSLNVEHYQGFLLSKPLSIDQFIERITG
jgi:EAL domain-containing protein (putative c-di-GMP-specific phosphodiesterase class I)